jgi:hypothetical protein
MDALFIASITDLAAAGWQISRGIQLLLGSHSASNLTLSLIASQCAIIATALSQISNQISNDRSGFSNKLTRSIGRNDFLQYGIALEDALIVCNESLKKLKEGIQKCRHRSIIDVITFKANIRLMWKEPELRERLADIKGVSDALQFLLIATQT